MRRTWGAILAMGLLAVACSGDSGLAANAVPTSTTVPEPATTTAADVTATTPADTTTTIDPVEAAWLEQSPPWPGEGSGEYRTTRFGTPFMFSTGETEWHTEIQTAEWMYFKSDFGGLDVFQVEGSVDQALTQWADMHDSLENASMTEPEPITVGGAIGVRFESVGLPTNLADIADTSAVVFSANDGGVPAGPAGLVYVVDVTGQAVVLAFNENIFDPEPGEIETAAAHALTIIDSITWQALG